MKKIFILFLIIILLFITGCGARLFEETGSYTDGFTHPNDCPIVDENNFQLTEPTYPLITETTATTNPLIPPTQTEPIEPTTDPEIQKWEKRYEEYPVATTVWIYLTKDMGYSDYVAAGIMGNMMTECGGQTLNLQWDARNKKSGCYGLCQWHPEYFPELQGATLEEQLDFAKTSFPKLLSRYMYIYKKGFTYEDFLALEDPRQVAHIFCVVYERPGSGPYTKRQENAMKAYEYFTS